MEHPVKRALRRDVLPYLVSARRLKRQWFYTLHVVFGYTTDLVIALAAIGISTPILALAGALSNTQKDITGPATISNVFNSLPAALVLPTALVIMLWVFLRVTFNRESGQKRAVLARSLLQAIRQAEANLPAILGKADPMPDLTTMLEKTIRPPVDRNIQEESWPWTPFAPDIDAEVTKQLEELCKTYETDWTAVVASPLQQRTA